jgi:DnaJ family protein C protein 28
MSVEEQIRRAMQEGKFDNLPGKGKPLPVEENPFEDPEWRMAYHMLRSSGYTLPWIELRNEIEAEAKAAAQDLARAWNWRQEALQRSAPPGSVEAEWLRAVARFKARIESVNGQIFTYNLQIPSPRFALLKRDPDQEIERLCAPKTVE